jgi:hypothetical protein
VSLPSTITQTNSELQIVDSILGNIHNKIHWQLRVSAPGAEALQVVQENDEKPSSYIIFTGPERGENVTVDLFIQIQFMYDNGILNPRAKFLVVISEKVTVSPQLLVHSIVEKLYMYYKIINLVVLTPVYKPLFPDVEENLTHFGIYHLNIYTWFPFTTNEHCDTVKYVTHLDTWLVEEQGHFLKHENLFPEKIPTDLQGCPIKISGYFPDLDTDTHAHYHTANVRHPNFTQIEINFIAITLQKLNLTLVYDFHPANNRSDFDLIFKVMLKVLTGACDMAVGGLPIDNRLAVFAEATIPYYQTVLSWYVPCARPVYRSGIIFKMLQLPMWFCVVVLFLAVIAITWILALQAKTKEFKHYTNVMNCFYVIWSVAVGVPVPKMPRTSLLRLFLLLWVLQCFVLTRIFEAFYISFLVQPEMEKQIESLDELVNSGLEYGYPSPFDKYIEEINEWPYKEIRKRYSHCASYISCAQRAIKSDFATISGPYLVDYLLSKKISNGLGHPICPISDNIFSFSISMHLSKGNPLLDSINQIIRRNLESGLTDRYFKKFRNLSIKEDLSLFNIKEQKSADNAVNYVVFSLLHLRVAFLILFVGLGVSFVSFLCEITYSRLSSKAFLLHKN